VTFALATLAAATARPSATPATKPATEPQPTQREVEVAPGKTVAYLVTEPARPTAPKDRWLLVFLHGAGGSLTGYNLSRPPYAKIRQALADSSAYVIVPALGGLHFMNDEAKGSLTKVIEHVVADYQIDPKRVHLMGTSMGAGSSLAYAVNFPDRVRSVCAIMPMTDFAEWARQKPAYAERMRVAYGGTVDERPGAYDANSAVKHADALAKIPVFLVHGTADTGVPISHSDALAAILKAKGYPCTYVRLEGAAHKDEIVAPLQDQIASFLIESNR
jgi:dipeptidyl aminopeptidase/acylaminoacyl peptidase